MGFRITFDVKMAVDTIEACLPEGSATLLRGTGNEFFSSSGAFPPDSSEISHAKDGTDTVILKCAASPDWDAEETISVSNDGCLLTRKFAYTVKQDFEGFFRTALLLAKNDDTRYTYPLQVYEKPLTGLRAMRCNSSWAVPLPAHIWTTGGVIAVYGIDRNDGSGTPEFFPDGDFDKGYVRLGSYHPDGTGMDSSVKTPETAHYSKGDVVRITEYISCERIDRTSGVPLLQAEKMCARATLTNQEHHDADDLKATADKLHRFLIDCGLWDPDGLGPGKGWYRNMWVYTTTENARKDPFCDLGWGEGYGVYTMAAILRHWSRTGSAEGLDRVDEMTRNIGCFRRGDGPEGPFYDRFIRKGVPPLHAKDTWGTCDFMGYKRIWTHCLANMGFQLIDMYETFADHPSPATREAWKAAALQAARFLADRQKADGDINDGFNEDDTEASVKAHRIPARTAACALWTRCAKYMPEAKLIDRALRLARFAAPEIDRYEFYNQMIDIHADVRWARLEVYDGENAAYSLLGSTELYEATRDPAVLRLCRESAAYLYSWIYFYDQKYGYMGRTRGGTTCRMTDYPLLYIGAGNIALPSLLKLSRLTGDDFHMFMAREILNCITHYLWDDPGKPWHGGIVHAIDQSTGEHWGPERKGQVDSGMTSGTALMDIEIWLDGGYEDATRKISKMV